MVLITYRQVIILFFIDYNIVIFTGDFNPTDPQRLYEIYY